MSTTPPIRPAFTAFINQKGEIELCVRDAEIVSVRAAAQGGTLVDYAVGDRAFSAHVPSFDIGDVVSAMGGVFVVKKMSPEEIQQQRDSAGNVSIQ